MNPISKHPGAQPSQTTRLQQPPFYGGASSSSGPAAPKPTVSASSSFQTNIDEVSKKAQEERQALINNIKSDADKKQRAMEEQTNASLRNQTSVAQGFVAGAAPPPQPQRFDIQSPPPPLISRLQERRQRTRSRAKAPEVVEDLPTAIGPPTARAPRSRSPPPQAKAKAKSVPKKQAAPSPMDQTQSQKKRTAEDEATGNQGKKKDMKQVAEALIPKKLSIGAGQPAANKQMPLPGPKQDKKKAAAAAEAIPAKTSIPVKKDTVKSSQTAPSKMSMTQLISVLSAARANSKLSDEDSTTFQLEFEKIKKVKNDKAAKKLIQDTMRELYKKNLYGKS
jgi:hypothetical protein